MWTIVAQKTMLKREAAPKTKSVGPGRPKSVGCRPSFPRRDVGDVRGRPDEQQPQRGGAGPAQHQDQGEDEDAGPEDDQADRRAAEALERETAKGHVERRRRAVADHAERDLLAELPRRRLPRGPDRPRHPGVHRDAVHGDDSIAGPELGVEAHPVDPDALARPGPGLGGDDRELRRAEQAKEQDRRREPERGAARHDGGEPAGIPERDPHVPSSSLPGDNGPA